MPTVSTSLIVDNLRAAAAFLAVYPSNTVLMALDRLGASPEGIPERVLPLLALLAAVPLDGLAQGISDHIRATDPAKRRMLLAQILNHLIQPRDDASLDAKGERDQLVLVGGGLGSFSGCQGHGAYHDMHEVTMVNPLKVIVKFMY